MFMHHQGDVLLPWKLETEQKAMLLYGRKEKLCREIWLKSNYSDVNFTNILVINVLFQCKQPDTVRGNQSIYASVYDSVCCTGPKLQRTFCLCDGSRNCKLFDIRQTNG